QQPVFHPERFAGRVGAGVLGRDGRLVVGMDAAEEEVRLVDALRRGVAEDRLHRRTDVVHRARVVDVLHVGDRPDVFDQQPVVRPGRALPSQTWRRGVPALAGHRPSTPGCFWGYGGHTFRFGAPSPAPV